MGEWMGMVFFDILRIAKYQIFVVYVLGSSYIIDKFGSAENVFGTGIPLYVPNTFLVPMLNTFSAFPNLMIMREQLRNVPDEYSVFGYSPRAADNRRMCDARLIVVYCSTGCNVLW